MHSVDHSLIHRARQFITGENVHQVNTWIFCYAMAQDSPCQKRYEELLRDFVTTKNLMLAARVQAKRALERGIELRRESVALNEEF
jgi:hypothetical protein